MLQRPDRLLGEAERRDRVALAHEVVAARRSVAAMAGAGEVRHLGAAAREDRVPAGVTERRKNSQPSPSGLKRPPRFTIASKGKSWRMVPGG